MNNAAIGIGLVVGLALGLAAAYTEAGVLQATAAGVAPLGELFVRAIRMVVIPLVAATVFEGVARLGDPRRLGRMGGLAVLFFWGTALLGIALGMGVMAGAIPLAPETAPPAADMAAVPEAPGLVELLVSLVPV
ncbi:MAG: cation:dicarboxylase symporter family transporter, partial [Gemmatimonadetes bacterium]|nr:cation:dicarboxylase symporter family transporter [Gemmatimonadota bacterium]